MKRKFLLVSKQNARGFTEHYVVVGEFTNRKDAIEAIIDKIKEFLPARDGGGTRFFRLEQGEYCELGRKFFIDPEKLKLDDNFKLPKKLREILEPF